MNLTSYILPNRAHAPAWLLLALLCAFGLFDHSLWSSNDTREGAMIREMVREGVWGTPVFNGQAYLEKPPLLHWTGVALCKLFGRVNEGLVRLPAALFGFGALWIIGIWSRNLDRPRAGVAAAFLCATTALYFEYTRIVLTDSALTFMVILALFLFWKAYAGRVCRLAEPTAGTHAGGGHGIIIWFAFLAVAALAFYAKGLIGPGLIWVPVGVFLVYRREWKLILALGAAFSVIFALALAPWVAALWRAGGRGFLYGVFWENQFGRFLTFNDPNLPLDPYFVHKESVLYYLFSLPVRLVPWTLLVLGALMAWFRPKSPAAGLPSLFLRFALIGMLALLHVSSSKAACYALPLFPILFLMTGIWLEDSAEKWNSMFARRAIGLSFGAVGIAALAAPLGYALTFLAGMELIWAPGKSAAVICFGLALLTLAVGGYALRQLRKMFRAGRRTDAILAAPIVLSALILLDAAIFMPAIDSQRTYEPLADFVRQELNAGRRMAMAGEHERDLGALMFYLDSRLTVVSVVSPPRRAGIEECSAFLYSRPVPAGIIVADGDLPRVERLLNGKPYQVVQIRNGGRKSGEFRVVMNHQSVPPQQEPPSSRATTE